MKYNKKYTVTFFLSILLTCVSTVNVKSQEYKRERDLFYTYMGTNISSGFNRIKYKDWFDDSRDTKNIQGTYFSGGVIINIFVNPFIGDFKMEYTYNLNDEYSIRHFYYSASGKYSYKINDLFSLSAGPGIYFDAPPASNSYNDSSGFLFSLGTIFHITFDIKLTADITGKYGSFGLGEESTKISYGINAGIMFKVGRI